MGTKGVMMCGVYGANPSLWPEAKLKEKGDKLPISIPRVVGADNEGITNNGYRLAVMDLANINH
jgi:hypothetical protein